METINRGIGITQSERYLAMLADRTFLDLWSYPNTFIDKKQNGRGAGKELCDLLVVCGDDVIIFSDKSCAWPETPSTELSWSRWFKKAVAKSVDQIRGAERWIRQYPGRIFIDNVCSRRLPISLPPPDRMRIHGIAVALGAQRACSKFFETQNGSLKIISYLKGPQHTDSLNSRYMPFAFGDVDPDGPFVHVFDETALDLVMDEMTTVTDFVNYLKSREIAVRHTNIVADSEADMLAAYLQTNDHLGNHYFPSEDTYKKNPEDCLMISPGSYDEYILKPERFDKIEADKISYTWDRLIRSGTKSIMSGENIDIFGRIAEVDVSEHGPRAMALETRVGRRALSNAFMDTINRARHLKKDHTFNIVTPHQGLTDLKCGYIFLVLAYRGEIAKSGYDDYRSSRYSLLLAHCFSSLYRKRNLNKIVGIATDDNFDDNKDFKNTADLIRVDIPEWTRDKEEFAVKSHKLVETILGKRTRPTILSTQEYPPSSFSKSNSPNRSQRRILKSNKNRKR